MILKRGEPPEIAYFEHEVEPLLGHDVELFENVTHAEKVELLGRARAHAVPDPVAGAVRSRDGRSDGVRHAGRDHELGCRARARRRRRDRLPLRHADDLAHALGLVDELDPAACRARVEERFSAAAMVRGYETVYAHDRLREKPVPRDFHYGVVLLQWPA